MNQAHKEEIQSLARKQLLTEIEIFLKSLSFERIDGKHIFDKRLNIKHHYIQWYHGSVYKEDGTLALERVKSDVLQTIDDSIRQICLDYHVTEFICTVKVYYNNSLLTIHIDY
jgi:hypothetical protein